MKTAINILVYVIEFLIAFSFFSDIFEPKRKTSHILLIGAGLYAAMFLQYHFLFQVALNFLVFCLSNIVFAYTCFQCRPRSAILGAIFLTTVMGGSEFLLMTIVSATTSMGINAYTSKLSTYFIFSITNKSLYFVLSKVATLCGVYLKGRQKTKTPFFLLLFPVSGLAVLYTLWEISAEYDLAPKLNAMVMGLSVAIIFAIILTYVFYGQTAKNIDELYQIKLEKEKLSVDQTYYDILEKQNTRLKTFAHDEKNHLGVIKSLAGNPEVDRYIDEVYGQLKTHSTFGNTKNKMLDLIINKYQYLCDSKGIDFYVSVTTANFSYIEDPDLITLLSNMLDNAVESAGTSEKKHIDLILNRINGFDILTCSNSCSKQPNTAGKTLLTTKSDEANHGLGVKSIKRIVEKYGGEFDWSYDKSKKDFVIHMAFNENTEGKLF